MLPRNTKTKIVVSAFVLSVLSAFALSTGANATSAQFPDENFYWCVINAYEDSNMIVESDGSDQGLTILNTDTGDGEEDEEDEYIELTQEQLATITSLYCSIDSTSRIGGETKGVKRLNVTRASYGPLIYDLTGIDLLPNLRSIYLGGNAVTTVDLSDNTNLETIDLSNNNTTSIILPRSNKLRSLSLADNKLRRIDLSVVPKLVELDLSGNYFTSIDLSGSPLLQYVYLDDDNLESLDLTHNPYLYGISTENNPDLSYLNLSQNSMIGGFKAGTTPVYLGNKAFVDEDGLVKVDLGNLTFYDEMDLLGEDYALNNGAPGLGGDSITGLPDIDEPVAPEMPFYDIDESDEYHVEIVNGVRILIFDDFNDETSNIIGLTSYMGESRLLINFADVREEPENNTPAVPDTGVFTNEETGHEFGFVAITVAAIASLGCIAAAVFSRIRKHSSVRKF